MTSKLNGISGPVTIRRAGPTTRSSPLSDGARLCALAIVLAAWTSFAQPQVEAPRQPSVTPKVPSSPEQDDRNGNRIDDRIDIEIHKSYITLADSTATEVAKSQAKALLAGRIEVRVLFNRQITSEEWGTFVALGGQVASVFDAGAYEWAGSIAREQIPALAILMGPDLVLIKTNPRSYQIRPPRRPGIRSADQVS